MCDPLILCLFKGYSDSYAALNYYYQNHIYEQVNIQRNDFKNGQIYVFRRVDTQTYNGIAFTCKKIQLNVDILFLIQDVNDINSLAFFKQDVTQQSKRFLFSIKQLMQETQSKIQKTKIAKKECLIINLRCYENPNKFR
ncbi:hypothetical protein pb186bvf_004504 [Paramecium bursaria]